MKAISQQYILCDLGDVLINSDITYPHEILKSYGINYISAMHEFEQHPSFNGFCRGKVTEQQFYIDLLLHLNPASQIQLNLLKEYMGHGILNYDPQIFALLKLFKQQHKKIIIVTDTHLWQSEWFRDRINFDSIADYVFESHLVGMLKADQEFFPFVCQEVMIDPSQALLIDDNPINIKNAASLGIATALYTGYDDLVKKIEKL